LSKARLEAFSDGVIAILITIMVFVPLPDLVIVLSVGIAMAGYDLFRTFFRGQDRNGD